jgi:lysine biosynthesis protein LysW
MAIFLSKLILTKASVYPIISLLILRLAAKKNNPSEVRDMAECPVCGADITLEADAEAGEIIACDDCGSELEITGKDSLQEAPQEEEDWGE